MPQPNSKPPEHLEAGFTLIELLVVMIIIGILAAIAIPSLMTRRNSAKEASAKADATNIAKEIAAALVDGPIRSLALPAGGAGGSITWINADSSTGSSDVKLSAGNVATFGSLPVGSGTNVTSTTLPGGDSYCVTVTPSGDAQAWSAGNNGLRKGTTCP